MLTSVWRMCLRNDSTTPTRAFARGETGRTTTGTFVTDRVVCETLDLALERNKDPQVVGAIAIAAGLAGAKATADAMRSRLNSSKTKEKLAANLTLGLALLGDTASIDELQKLFADSSQRPEVLEHAAIALGCLGDPRISELLQARLAQTDGNIAALGAVANALGLVGKQNAVMPLVEMLLDQSRSSVQRASAATALGGIADPRPLPWNTPYSANSNYRATAETLTDRTAGVLDLL